MGMFRSLAPDGAADGRAVIDVGSATATGPRPDNQDRVATDWRWAVVSDGAGGHAGGALAAQLAVDAAVARLQAAPNALDERAAVQAVADADAAVRAGKDDSAVASMAATLTLAAAVAVGSDASHWSVINVGDSPAWHLTARGLRRVTEEDNVAAELLRAGAISAEEARSHPGRHLITRAMGSLDTRTISPVAMTLEPGDALVLASDGIEVVDERAMMELMSATPTSDTGGGAARCARLLVEAALARHTTDNVTVAVIRHVPR
jgi:protein phosphatase